jgi:ribonucleotide monophosphatase NagD (HAD superfamily)
MSVRAGVMGILVLSGEATQADVDALSEENMPNLVVDSVDLLLR